MEAYTPARYHWSHVTCLLMLPIAMQVSSLAWGMLLTEVSKSLAQLTHSVQCYASSPLASLQRAQAQSIV